MVGPELALHTSASCFSTSHILDLRNISLVVLTMSFFMGLSKFLLCVIGLCALFASVSADGLNLQTHPAAGEAIEVGRAYTIVWTPGTIGNVSIVLKANSDWTAQTIIYMLALNLAHILSSNTIADSTCSSFDREQWDLHMDT